jgi:regulator of protease activity HflC (stomatin/prohibitin superfamily)
MLEWLSRLIDSFLSWIPRLVHVKRTHGAVIFTGANSKEWKPGLHLYWPLISEYIELPVVRQTHNAATQVVLTDEGQSLAVSAVIVYEISDVMAALSASYEVEDTIGDVSLTSVMEVIAGEPLKELAAKQKDGRLAHELTLKARKRLRPFGVKVQAASLTDFSTCQVVKHLGEGLVAPLPASG